MALAAQPGWRLPLRPAAQVALAGLLGLGLATLPLEAAAALLAPFVLLLILVEPASGIGLTLLAAPTRAWLNVHLPGLPLDPGQVLLAVTLAAWLARGVARRRLLVAPMPKLLAIPLGLFLLAGAWSLWSTPSLTDGMAELVKFAQLPLMVLLVQDAAARGRLGWLLAAVVAAGTAQGLIGLWQFGIADSGPDSFIILGGRYRAYGTFEQPNPFAGFMGLIWPVAAGLGIGLLVGPDAPWRQKGLALWQRYGAVAAALGAAGLCLAALVASFSRGSWLGAAAAGLALAVFLPRQWWIGLALAVVGALAAQWVAAQGLLPASLASRLGDLGEVVQVYDARGVPINDENFAVVQRLAFWQTAQAMADDNPWLGVGLGNYPLAYPGYALLNWPQAIGHAHNIYLNMLAETGTLGLAAYLALWAAVVVLTIRVLRTTTGWQRGAALGMMGAWMHLSVHQIVDNLYVNNVHLYLGVFMGVLAALTAGQPSAEATRSPARIETI